MAATVIAFAPRNRVAPATECGEVVRFPHPPGGANVTRLLNAILQAAQQLRCGRFADTDCIEDFRRAVADPAWDDGNAQEILDQCGVAKRWLLQAAKGRWELCLVDGSYQRERPAVGILYANAVTVSLNNLLAAMDILRGRCGPEAPTFDASAGARGLMDLGEIE